jgi:putative cell wall-binding protein
VLLASGTNYPDALAAGPAAAHLHGAVLLTNNAAAATETTSYLTSRTVTVYAIGGPAATADPSAAAVVGADRYATAAAVADRFFTAPVTAGVATGLSFPDALSGGAQLALAGAPLLLAAGTVTPASTATYLTENNSTLTMVHVYGGTSVLTNAVLSQLQSDVAGS